MIEYIIILKIFILYVICVSLFIYIYIKDDKIQEQKQLKNYTFYQKIKNDNKLEDPNEIKILIKYHNSLNSLNKLNEIKDINYDDIPHTLRLD